MLDLTNLIILSMKKTLFKEEEKNSLAKQILGELKTKLKDVREEFSAKIQHSILKKMEADREKSLEVYLKGGRSDLAIKEGQEKEIILFFMKELEKELPKPLEESEILSILTEKSFKNIGECMKWFSQNYPDQDKKIISQTFKQLY